MFDITNKQKEERLLDMQQKVSDTFVKHNDTSYTLFNIISKFSELLPTSVNNLAYLSDMITDALVVSGRSSLSSSVFQLPVVANTLNLDKDNSALTLNFTSKKDYSINVKRSYLQSSNSFSIYTSDKKSLSSFEEFLKGTPILIETPDEYSTYTFAITLESKVSVSAVDLQLGLETEAYPLLSEIYYINDNNKKVYVTLLNNSDTKLDLDLERKKDNFYRILLPNIKTNRLYFTLESKEKSSLILEKLAISSLKYEAEGELTVGPITSTSPILKAAMEVVGDTDSANFYISADNVDWYEVALATDIPFEKEISKILAFNTIGSSSLKREEDFKTLYIKIKLTHFKSRDGAENLQLLRSDINTTGILSVDSSKNEVVYVLPKPVYYGDVVFKKNISGSSITTPQFVSLTTPSNNYVRGFASSYILEDGAVYSESKVKTKPLRVGADTIDLTVVDPYTCSLYGYNVVTQDDRVNTKVQKDIVFKLKPDFSKDVYTLIQNNKQISVDFSLGYISDSTEALFFVDADVVKVLDSTSKLILELVPTVFEESFYINLISEMFEVPTAEKISFNMLYPFKLNDENSFSLQENQIVTHDHLVSFKNLSKLFKEKIDFQTNLSKENGSTGTVVTDLLLRDKYTERSEETITAYNQSTVLKLKNKFIKKGTLKLSIVQ